MREFLELSKTTRFTPFKLGDNLPVILHLLRRRVAVAEGVGDGDKSGEGDGEHVREVNSLVAVNVVSVASGNHSWG